MKQRIALICPVYNEEENIKIFVSKFNDVFKQNKKYIFNIIFLDNNSNDKTVESIKNIIKKNKQIHLIKYTKNVGVMKSMYTGILNMPEHFDAFAFFDCDLQDPPELLSEFLKKWDTGFKTIYGKRIKRTESFIIKILRYLNKKINRILNIDSNIESGAWLLDKDVLQIIKKQNLYNPYLPALIERINLKPIAVSYERNQRIHGKSKFNIKNYFSYAADGIFNGSIAPLRVAVFFGIFIAFISLLLSLYFIIAKFLIQIQFEEGVAAILTLMLFNFSMNFIFLGIIGEYIGRLYKNKEDNLPAIIEENTIKN